MIASIIAMWALTIGAALFCQIQWGSNGQAVPERVATVVGLMLIVSASVTAVTLIYFAWKYLP